MNTRAYEFARMETKLGAGKTAWSRRPTEATSQIDRRKDQSLFGLELLASVPSPEDTGVVVALLGTCDLYFLLVCYRLQIATRKVVVLLVPIVSHHVLVRW